MKRISLPFLVAVLLVSSHAQADGDSESQRFGVPVQFEIWKWGDDAASRQKVMDLAEGMRIEQHRLPLAGMQIRFRIAAPHDAVWCEGRTVDGGEKWGWGPEKVDRKGSTSWLYRYCAESSALYPAVDKYRLEVEAKDGGTTVARSRLSFEILPGPPPPAADGLLHVGMFKKFPEVVRQGAPVEVQLWAWNADPARRRKIAEITDAMQISCQSLPTTGGVHYLFRIPARHDTVSCRLHSSDGLDDVGWGPERVETKEPGTPRLYRVFAEQLPFTPQISRYSLRVEAKLGDTSVAKRVVHFAIVDDRPAPCRTHYLHGRKDCAGNPLTTSEPVELAALNQTPELIDNDYPFEPQRAYNTVNYERFPPFRLPERFIAVWGSRRFAEEGKIGGPLNRGFTTLGVIRCEQDNLTIPQRAWFHTPDQQVAFINEWYKQEPKKYADLKGYADYRSAFVSTENAYALGRRCYESWGAGGYGPYDPGLYGWDEEQMWPSIGTQLLKDHPELVPERLRHLRDKDPQCKDPATQGILNAAYERAQAEFIGHGYRGARDVAAAHGRKIKIWHYGSKAPNGFLFLNPGDAETNPANGKPKHEDVAYLPSWFKTGNHVNFQASEYSRQIDYFHHDFYYFNVFADQSSLYEKDSQGKYVLDARGRRKIRQDVIEERMYADPVKVGYDDFAGAPLFFQAFIAKAENCQFWLNGGRYYKTHGTFITDKGLIPTIRPGNQETGGESSKLGSRPISPYLAEAATIYAFMIGLEGIYYWDARNYGGPVGYGRDLNDKPKDSLGDIEFAIKGLHRVSHLRALFEGEYDFVRPVAHYDTSNRDHPVIRGILNGRYLALAMTNPYLDPGETQPVELWYDAPYEQKSKVWSGAVTLQARKNHIFHCKLPPLPLGAKYDPDKLRLRYTCRDGNFARTYTVTGSYNVPCLSQQR